MSERKVLNKYYPPDFDPSKIPRLRLPKERQYTVRLMAPCNMRCTTCGEYIYKGKKFNARKETVQNEEYLGIKIYRFYIKCPRCLAEITFKTDPENADYIVEHGASRNFQALKLAEEAAEKEAKEKEEEEKNNPMKLLENRTKASKQEMESLEALEEIRDLNQRHSKVDFEELLKRNHTKLLDEQKRQEEEDEAFIRSVFLTADGEKVKRIFTETDVQSNKEKNSKDEIGLRMPTDILCEGNSDSLQSAAKKLKFSEENVKVSSRQKSIDMLKKAVKVKTTSSTTACPVFKVTESQAACNILAIKTDGNSSEKDSGQQKSALGLLSAYSDSDSESG